jgi:hypothetical protein
MERALDNGYRPVLADVGFHGKSALLVRPHYVYD